MAVPIRFKRRAVGGSAGAPAALKTAEPAYNMQDGKMYIGFGDDGSGNATSIKAFGADNWIVNIPAGGANGYVLSKLSAADGDVGWAAPAVGGSSYTASGNGIELSGSEFQLNFSEIATGINLGNYALTSSLANYALLAANTFTGKQTFMASGTGAASINLPHGVAPTTPDNGDVWTTSAGGMFARINGATKTVAFTDSALTGNTTGSAATLTTSRNFSISGGGITATAVGFNGSAAVVLNASVDAGHITLARMANLAANSFIGNNTGSAAVPVALTVAQAKTLLAISFSDVSGTASTGQIPNLDANKITSGTIDPARLPAAVFQTPVVSSGGIAALDGGQQAAIAAGTIVVTSDGRFWIYNTGSKTVEGSYYEMADRTPDWSVIANKPSFATVATTGAYSDLSGLPTLGSMASQNSGAVNITGGSISNVDLDGGTF